MLLALLLRRRRPLLLGLTLHLFAALGVARGQVATPQRVVTDDGGGTLPGISGFELFRNGVYWWKSGAQNSEVARREGTLAVNATLGIRPPLVSLSPSSRYLGRGFGFQVDGVTRDDLFVYYAANGYLRRKPLQSQFADPLADSTRITVGRLTGSPPRFEQVPVAANGAVLLYRGDVWGSYASGAEFLIERPLTSLSLRSFLATGGAVQRMEAIPVLQSNGSKLKDSLLVLTQDHLLYQFDLDPFNSTPFLLARNVWDFAVRDESTTSGGGISISRVHTTAIYAAVGDVSSARTEGRLLRFSARDRTVSVAYATGSVGLQLRGVAVTPDRIYATVTPLRCGGVFGCSYDTPNAQILSRSAPAHSDFGLGSFATIVDRITAGGALEGMNLRSDRRWLYWSTGNDLWRVAADAKPVVRDLEVLGLEVVQTTQDFDNSTRLAANKATVARAYARLAQDSTGVGRYTVNALLRGFMNNQPLPGSPLSPVNNPVITSTGNLATLRSAVDNAFLFELPFSWVQRGQLRVEFELNPALGIPETGPNPSGNNTLTSGTIEVVGTGSPCLVLVPIQTEAPDYDPRDPASGFAAILGRAQSLLPIDHFRFVFRGDRISRPVPRIRYSPLGFPYSSLDFEPFDVTSGFDEPLAWLKLYAAFERNPRDCGDTHYVGTVHWLANTTSDGSVALGLATRPTSGVARDLVVKMEPPGTVAGNAAWNEPRGGETLAHELAHNYTLQHIDQTMSPLACGGGRPLRAGPYPLDACTIGIMNPAALATELADRTTQFGFDPLSLTVIGPTNAADLMSYRSSSWLSKPSLDALFVHIPGYQAPAPRSLAAVPPLPARVVLVHGTLDLQAHTAVLRPCHRLPTSVFDTDKVSASLNPPPVDHTWRLRWVDTQDATLAEFPLLWERNEDGNPFRASFTQFLADAPNAARLQVLEGAHLVTECQPSRSVPTLEKLRATHDPITHRLTATWAGNDADLDPLAYTVQFSADDGESWETLQVGFPEETFDADTLLLPGGDRCRVRVIASDGFHAALMESSSFSLPRHAPEAVITGIQEGARLPFGQSQSVEGLAYDAEDGSLPAAQLQWRLEGAEDREGSGPHLVLADLSPGSYTLELTATDSEGAAARARIGFEVDALPILEASEPLLDGDCGDAAYANAPLVRLLLSGGGFAHGRLVHAGGALHACVSDLPFGTDPNAPTTVGWRVNRQQDPTATPVPADLPGYFVDEFGLPSQRWGETTVTPEHGFIAVISRGEATWSAELRIEDSLIGGWERPSPVQLVQEDPSTPANTRTWPATSLPDQAAPWASAWFGTSPAPPNRAPVAVAKGPPAAVPAKGDLVFLDGSGSWDPDGDPLTYHWIQTEGPSVSLQNANSPVPSFPAMESLAGRVLGFQLTVRDAASESVPSPRTVTVTSYTPASPPPTPPEAVTAGDSQGGRRFTLLWPGSPGDRCAVQSSRDLVTWEPTTFATADYLGRIQFEVPPEAITDTETAATVATGHRFYRAIDAPQPPPVDPFGALAFDGVNDFVEVPHRAALNAYPLTLAAWFRTSRSGGVVDGIVSKYVDGSFNGYGMFVYLGRLRAFYFSPPLGQVWGGGQGLDAGPVADGAWHHAVFVVDATGGRLFVDGVLRAAQPWVGPAGPPTTTAPLQIGRYHTYPNAWLGSLDDVVVWNASTPGPAVANLAHRRVLAGEVPSPLGLWHFDEQEGLSTQDGSGNGFHGFLRNGVLWIPSEVPR